MQCRTAVFKPEPVVEVIAPAADFPACIEIEHSDAWQLQAPPATIEIPAIEALGTNRVAAAKNIEQFPFNFSGAIKDALDYLANVSDPTTGSIG